MISQEPIKPLVVDGEEYYIMQIHPRAAFDITVLFYQKWYCKDYKSWKKQKKQTRRGDKMFELAEKRGLL